MVFHKGGPVSTGVQGWWWQNRFIRMTPVLDDAHRVMPPTVAHDEVATHPFGCRCRECDRYPADLLRRLKRAAIRDESSRRREAEALRTREEQRRRPPGS